MMGIGIRMEDLSMDNMRLDICEHRTRPFILPSFILMPHRPHGLRLTLPLPYAHVHMNSWNHAPDSYQPQSWNGQYPSPDY